MVSAACNAESDKLSELGLCHSPIQQHDMFSRRPALNSTRLPLHSRLPSPLC